AASQAREDAIEDRIQGGAIDVVLRRSRLVEPDPCRLRLRAGEGEKHGGEGGRAAQGIKEGAGKGLLATHLHFRERQLSRSEGGKPDQARVAGPASRPPRA